MRVAFTALLLAAAFAAPVHARDNAIKFEGVQEHCVQAGKIKFGAGTPWSNCSVTKGRWVATLDFIDMYQAQYCLGSSNGACAKRALLLFSNRAYTPKAGLMLQRIDPGATEYDDPRLVQTKYGDILTLTAHLPGGKVDKSYYVWRTGRWITVNARGWLHELPRQLPKQASIKADAWPDLDSMSAQVALHQNGNADADDSVAEVELGLAHDRFTVNKVTLAQKAE